jgi:hypothetical protein
LEEFLDITCFYKRINVGICFEQDLYWCGAIFGMVLHSGVQCSSYCVVVEVWETALRENRLTFKKPICGIMFKNQRIA